MRPPYRGNVDGLRAVAVLLVVAFHAFPRKVPGGFSGVDIFFVISGFLITSLILRSKENGDFSVMDFYARRIKRIFPALIVMIAACLAVGWIVMFPGEYRDLGKHSAAGAGFVANFSFLQEAGYFDCDSGSQAAAASVVARHRRAVLRRLAGADRAGVAMAETARC